MVTMGFGGEVRAIGFEKIGVGGDSANRFMEIAGVFESGNSSEGNGVAEGNEFIGLGGGTGEAVKDRP